jgi:hypothetical protein
MRESRIVRWKIGVELMNDVLERRGHLIEDCRRRAREW